MFQCPKNLASSVSCNYLVYNNFLLSNLFLLTEANQLFTGDSTLLALHLGNTCGKYWRHYRV